jgi:hypothetical protein
MNDTRVLHPVADSLDGRTTSEAVIDGCPERGCDDLMP